MSAEDRLFDWWVEQADGSTLDEAQSAYEEWLENVREVLRNFWGNGS